MQKSLFLIPIVFWIGTATATDRFFRDLKAISSNQKYEIRAESPDNKKAGRRAFQGSFVYTLTEKSSGKILWTRKQAMTQPETSTGSSFWEEASPVQVFASDAGWTVIQTAWEGFISIDIQGKEHCRIKLLEEALTKEENAAYVRWTTAGYHWEGRSLWYFLELDKQTLFVIRPWWGRRIIIDVEQGKLLAESTSIAQSSLAYERDFVLSHLQRCAAEYKKFQSRDDTEDHPWLQFDDLTAAYLAGRLKAAEAIPYLRELEQSDYSGSWTTGGLGILEKFEGEVDPHTYSTCTLRRIVQLSLRRLGETPKPLPVHIFDVRYQEYKKDHPYRPKPLSAPRGTYLEKIVKGMKAEQVLDLIGSPDFVGNDAWEYDIDTKPPFSFVIKWDVRHVIETKKLKTPLWQDGLTRDKQINH
jgi:hypothetical protein